MSVLISGSANQTSFNLNGVANYQRNATSNNLYASIVSLSFLDVDYTALSTGSVEIVRDGNVRSYLFIDNVGRLNVRLRASTEDGNTNVTHTLTGIPDEIVIAAVYDVDRVKFFVDGVMVNEQTGLVGMFDAVNQVPVVNGLTDGYDYVLHDYAIFDQSIPTDAEIAAYSAGTMTIANFAAEPVHAFNAVGDGIISSIPAEFGGIDLIQSAGETAGDAAPRAVSNDFDINNQIAPPDGYTGVTLADPIDANPFIIGSAAGDILAFNDPDIQAEVDGTVTASANNLAGSQGQYWYWRESTNTVFKGSISAQEPLQPVLNQLAEIMEKLNALEIIEQKVNQLMIRDDVSDTIRNTYSQDGSSITNSQFTLTKVSLPDGTFRVDKS